MSLTVALRLIASLVAALRLSAALRPSESLVATLRLTVFLTAALRLSAALLAALRMGVFVAALRLCLVMLLTADEKKHHILEKEKEKIIPQSSQPTDIQHYAG